MRAADEDRSSRPADRRPLVAAPGGPARLRAEVSIRPAARPDEEIVVQGLEAADGAPLLRLGYRRSGRMLRGPVTVAPDELTSLAAAVRLDPVLSAGLPEGSG